MIYIEKFVVSDQYDLEAFFQNISETQSYERTWPLVVVGGHYREDLYVKAFDDFRSGKSRTKPSNCLLSSFESVERVIAKQLRMKGPVFVATASCTSGAYGIYTAYGLSLATGTPVIVASGSTLIDDGFGNYWFRSLRAISNETGIPFDKNSKGFRAGTSQTFFVVSAKPINPVANIKHINFFCLTNETTDTGPVEQIKEQLFSTLDTSDICWWNAHSPGTPVGDAAEYDIFKDIVGDRDVPISSLKGQYGHSLAGSYLLEVGKGIESIQQGIIPANVGITDPINDDPRIITTPVPTTEKTFLKFNMGFGGKNVVSIIEVL